MVGADLVENGLGMEGEEPCPLQHRANPPLAAIEIRLDSKCKRSNLGSVAGGFRFRFRRVIFNLLFDLVQLLPELGERFNDRCRLERRCFRPVGEDFDHWLLPETRQAVGGERAYVQDDGLGPELCANLGDGFLGGGGGERDGLHGLGLFIPDRE